MGIRIGRRRPSHDFGSGSAQRGRSCSDRVVASARREQAPDARTSQADVVLDSPPRRRLARCESLPPTGTAKADEAADAQGKARAVAMLQRLFAEEMAKAVHSDPNAAAAVALRRLNQA